MPLVSCHGQHPSLQSTGQYYEVSLAEALGITISYAPDELAPQVDYERLRALVRRELPPETVEKTYGLIARFQSWHEAWRETVLAAAEQGES